MLFAAGDGADHSLMVNAATETRGCLYCEYSQLDRYVVFKISVVFCTDRITGIILVVEYGF